MGVLLFYVCRAVHCPVTSPKPRGKAGISMEAQPSQQRLTLDFNTVVANKGLSQLLVGRDNWEQRKAAWFYLWRS